MIIFTHQSKDKQISLRLTRCKILVLKGKPSKISKLLNISVSDHCAVAFLLHDDMLMMYYDMLDYTYDDIYDI